jgi:hypothetical protein
MLSAGLPGPILSQRVHATEWGAQDYDAYINAAVTNHRLFPEDPPVVAGEPDDGIILAVGRSMQYRVVLVPINCQPRASGLKIWFDKQKYWDPDELQRQRKGVSAAIHTDAAPAAKAFATRFIELMKPIVEACIADRPPLVPTKRCQPVP